MSFIFFQIGLRFIEMYINIGSTLYLSLCYWHIKQVQFLPMPFQQQTIPLWIGGM